MIEVYAGSFFSLQNYKEDKIVKAPEYIKINSQYGLCGTPYSSDTTFNVDLENGTTLYFSTKKINHFNNFCDSYLKYGYGELLEEYGVGNFQYDINLKQSRKNYYSECRETAFYARDLALLQNQELSLFLSGGVDSEAMAQIFVQNKIKFTPTIIRMKNNLNHYDIKYALSFCNDYELIPKIIELDVIEFIVSKQYEYYGLKYRTTFPEMMMLFYALDNYKEAFPVFPANIPFVVTKGPITSFNLLIDQFRSIWRYLFLNNRLGIENFFYHTSTQYYSAVNDSIYYGYLYGKNMDYLDKVSVYNYFGMPVRPKPYKYTGWEKVRKMFSDSYEKQTGQKKINALSKLYFNNLNKFFTIEHNVPGTTIFIE